MTSHPSMWNAMANTSMSSPYQDVGGTRTRVLEAGVAAERSRPSVQ